jgi:DNA-binding IclR family transcriptional regulator
MGDVFDLMADGRWRSLDEISDLTGYPQASVSAHLRGFRSERYGCHTVDRKYISKGLHHYKLSINYSTEKQLELL